MLVFDNGTCATLRMQGSVKEGNGTPVSDVALKLQRTSDATMEMMAHSDTKGIFTWENIGIYKDMSITPYIISQQESRLSVFGLMERS